MKIFISFEKYRKQNIIQQPNLIIMKKLKSLSRKELKTIKGAASTAVCPPGDHYCPDAGVCVPIIVECYIIVPELPEDGGCLSC